MSESRAMGLATDVAIGAGGLVLVWWLMRPVGAAEGWQVQWGTVAGLGGPTLVAGGFCGVVQAFFLRAGGAVWNVVATIIAVGISSVTAVLIDAFCPFTLLASTGPPPDPTIADLATAHALWVVYLVGLFGAVLSAWGPLAAPFRLSTRTSKP